MAAGVKIRGGRYCSTQTYISKGDSTKIFNLNVSIPFHKDSPIGVIISGRKCISFLVLETEELFLSSV